MIMCVNIIIITQRNWELYPKQFGHDDLTTKNYRYA